MLCHGPRFDFEVETGLDVIDTAQSLIRDLRDVQAVRIEAPYQHKWFFYFSEGQFEGDKEKINDIWFSINLETGNRLGYFGNAFLKNQKNAEGSVHSRNRIEFMRRANIRHAQTDSIRVGSYIGYRSGGQPHILDLKKRVELLQRQLAKYKDCIKAETFDRITQNLSSIAAGALAKNPLSFADIASEKEDARGAPIGYRIFYDNGGVIHWDLTNPIIRSHALDYYNNKIKNRPALKA